MDNVNKGGRGGGGGGVGGSTSDGDVKDLRNKLKMKENEINLLMNLIKKNGINPNDGSLKEITMGGNNTYHNDKDNGNKYGNTNG